VTHSPILRSREKSFIDSVAGTNSVLPTPEKQKSVNDSPARVYLRINGKNECQLLKGDHQKPDKVVKR
jgi:hypothetical protein